MGFLLSYCFDLSLRGDKMRSATTHPPLWDDDCAINYLWALYGVAGRAANLAWAQLSVPLPGRNR